MPGPPGVVGTVLRAHGRPKPGMFYQPHIARGRLARFIPLMIFCESDVENQIGQNVV
jgi:hypothetical protein